MKQTHFPSGIGDNIDVPLLHNQYQQDFQAARRLRFCLVCRKVGSMSPNGYFDCPTCGTRHISNLTAPRLYNRLGVLAGRGGGKTLIGAHAAREEMMVPNSIGWVMGPTFKVLHDSTFPTLIKLIPKSWVKKWSEEHQELTLINNAMVAFRSLEDPERARGPHGVGWGWFDEAAQSPERAYEVFEPTLLAANGIVFATTTVFGFDWTWKKIEQQAINGEPGYWFTRYWSEENPLFRTNPQAMAEIDKARRTWDPAFFAQEYRAERRNAQGLVYKFDLIEEQTIPETPDDVAIKKFIPEWPRIDPSRKILIGLDSGADHPFGALKIVVTERGLVVVGEYLERMQAVSQQWLPVQRKFRIWPNAVTTFAANKNEVNLRLEWGLLGVGIAPAENKHEVGIQRVSSWLYSRQLWFYAPATPKTRAQLQSYHYKDNHLPTTGEKTVKEEVFKLDDELCDALRYALMVFPELPKPKEALMTEGEQKRWDAFDDRTRADIERLRAYNRQVVNDYTDEEERRNPVGEMFNSMSQLW